MGELARRNKANKSGAACDCWLAARRDGRSGMRRREELAPMANGRRGKVRRRLRWTNDVEVGRDETSEGIGVLFVLVGEVTALAIRCSRRREDGKKRGAKKDVRLVN